MKQQIHAYRGHGEIAVEGHNIKLGRGGIREIEFFVQTQQLIAGGRHAELRGRETVATLGALAAGGWIDAAARDELTAAYEFLRRVEHRLQMIADEQTHTLPADPAAARSVCAVSRLSRPRRLRRSVAWPFARGRAALCAAVRARAGDRSRGSRTCRSQRPRASATRSIGLRKWAFGSRARSPAPCAAGATRHIGHCGASRRAPI